VTSLGVLIPGFPGDNGFLSLFKLLICFYFFFLPAFSEWSALGFRRRFPVFPLPLSEWLQYRRPRPTPPPPPRQHRQTSPAPASRPTTFLGPFLLELGPTYSPARSRQFSYFRPPPLLVPETSPRGAFIACISIILASLPPLSQVASIH